MERQLVSLECAQREHEKLGFKAYTGPKLKGPRCVIPFEAKNYPDAFVNIGDPPDFLYLIGNVEALSEGLAVIGARKATPYGKACARHFAGLAVRKGIPVISGGALGCDSEAHKAALEEGGLTIVFLGGGCDWIYPASNFSLFQEIIDSGGAVVSEHPWNFPPLPYSFRQRNRLIAGLARATLIVEAGLPSGTFSTADEALEAGKEVLVVPGAITSKTSAGSNRLLSQGATPIVDDESFNDALFAIFGCLKESGLCQSKSFCHALNSEEGKSDPLLDALLDQPMRLDQMARHIQIPPGKDVKSWIQVRLVELERDGFITRYPDGRYGPKSL